MMSQTDAAVHAVSLICDDAPKQSMAVAKEKKKRLRLIAGNTNIICSSRVPQHLKTKTILWFAVHHVRETRRSQL